MLQPAGNLDGLLAGPALAWHHHEQVNVRVWRWPPRGVRASEDDSLWPKLAGDLLQTRRMSRRLTKRRPASADEAGEVHVGEPDGWLVAAVT